MSNGRTPERYKRLRQVERTIGAAPGRTNEPYNECDITAGEKVGSEKRTNENEAKAVELIERDRTWSHRTHREKEAGERRQLL